MTEKELQELQRGDIVQHRNGLSYVIIGKDALKNLIGVRHIIVTNLGEWTLFSKSEKCAK